MDNDPSCVSGPIVSPVVALTSAANAAVPVSVSSSICCSFGINSPCLAPPTFNSTGGTASGHARSSSTNGASVPRGADTIPVVCHGPRGPASSNSR